MQLRFEPHAPLQLPLLTAWLKEPHERGFWDDGERDEASVRAHPFEQSRDVPGYVFTLAGRPAGFIQHERVTPAHEYAAWAAEHGETWGLDLFIGEPEWLGRGLGPEVIRAFVAFTRAAHPVRRFVIDPESRNLRARRAYEKAGFHAVDTLSHFTLMTLDLL